jgi:LCP family protein required for cell wall assembly
MTRNQKFIIASLALIACALISIVGVYGYQSYRAFAIQPLGPALPTYAPITMPPTWTPTAGGTPMGAVTLVPTMTVPATNTPEPICHGPDVMYILVVGADSRQDAYTYGLADAVRIARVEFKTPKVTILEFPRDLWVEIPYIEDNLKGLKYGKLNQSYLFGQPGYSYWNDPSGGPGLLSLTLNMNFDVHSNNYVSVNMRTFENVVNAVGGIDLYVADEETAIKTGLSIGTNHLDGPGALKVARNREESTFERVNNQNRVLCALQQKLASPKVVTQIPDLIKSFRDNILTDLSPDEITQLACIGMKIRPQNIVFARFPDELFKPSRKIPDPYNHNPHGTFIWDVDFNTLRNYVMQFESGEWPQPNPAGIKSHNKVTCE